MARNTASNRENKMQQVVGNMIERPRAHSPACRLLKRVLQNSQMAVRGSLARAQRQWDCEAVSGSHALLSGRGKSQDRGAFNALHAKGGSGAPHAAHAQQKICMVGAPIVRSQWYGTNCTTRSFSDSMEMEGTLRRIRGAA